MSRSRFLAGSLLALFAIQSAAFSASDVVQLINGNRISGRVQSDNAKGVELKIPDGSRMNFANKQVDFVEYEETPMDYHTGLQAYNRRDYSSAIDQLQNALREPHSPHLKQYIMFYLASSLKKSGNLKAAASTYIKIARQGKKSRFMFTSFSELIEIYIKVKQIDKAVDMRKKLMKLLDVRESNAPASIMYFGARIFEAQKKWSKAITAYKNAANDNDYRLSSVSGVTRCSIGAGKFADAAREAKKALKQGSTKGEARAELYVLYGDALFAQDNGKDEEALYAYLRVVTSILTGTNAVEVRACKGAAKVFEKLGQKDKAQKVLNLIGRIGR